MTTEPWSLTSHAMMNVALVDVAVANRAGAVKDVAVASAVDRHLGADRELALLALEDTTSASEPGRPRRMLGRCRSTTFTPVTRDGSLDRGQKKPAIFNHGGARVPKRRGGGNGHPINRRR